MKAKLGWIGAALWIAVACTGCPPREATSSTSRQAEPEVQYPALQYTDQVYAPNARTVQCYRLGNPLSYPILYLGEESRLVLEWDMLQTADMNPEDYWIDYIACDQDWTPNNLLPLEFLEGFSNDRIYFNMRSQNTRIPYVHYRYELPAEGSQFKRSGNYLVRIYRAGNERDLVLTRRIVVADHKVDVIPQIGMGRMAADRRRIQRVDFSLKFTQPLPGIFDPRTDLSICILQNFRWDNAVCGLQPTFISPEQLDYTFDAALNFEGGNEYRPLDIRSTRFRTQAVKAISNEDSVVRYTLHMDEPRLRNTYFARPDLNGNFLVEVQEYPNASYESDYVFVRFALKWGEPIKGKKVYLAGKFNDWRRDGENELSYNPAGGCYEAELLLKQGWYDYGYVAVDTASGKLDEARFEGSHAETENYYTILVYYKPIGARAAELVGMSHVNFYDR